MHEQVHPLFGGEVGPAVLVIVQIHVGHLNGLEVRNHPTNRRLVVVGIRHGEDAPDASATEQFLVGIHNAVRHGNSSQSKVGELSLVLVGFVVQDHIHLVDDFVASGRADFVLDHLGVGAVDIVVLDDVAHLVHPAVDDLLVIDGAVLAKQVFEDVSWNGVGALTRDTRSLRTTFPSNSAMILSFSVIRNRGK